MHYNNAFIDDYVSKIPSDKTLSIGIVDARSVWLNDLSQSIKLVSNACEKLGSDRVIIANSAPLFNCPYSVKLESDLDVSLKNKLSFAVEKMNELNIIKTAINKGIEAVKEEVEENKKIITDETKKAIVSFKDTSKKPYLRARLNVRMTVNISEYEAADSATPSATLSTTPCTVLFAMVDVGEDAATFTNSHFLTTLNGNKMTAAGLEERVYAYNAATVTLTAAYLQTDGSLVYLETTVNPAGVTDDIYAFEGKQPQPINQRQLIKRDTVVVYGNDRYHCYVQVNPTTYKVFKTSYNDDGVEVENIYYDNIIHMGIFKGAAKVYSSNFYKQDFKGKVPADFLNKSVLSDFIFNGIDAEGVHYNALLGIPDSPSSYVVEVLVSFGGKLTLRATDD